MPASIGRRGFVKGAVGLGAVGAAASLGMPCRDRPGAAQAQAAQAQDAQGGSLAGDAIEVVGCDILVIGGGLGAMQVAMTAAEQGRHVTILDKGPFRHSGGLGYNWDCIGCWLPDKGSWQYSNYMNTTNNTELHYRLFQEYPLTDDSLMYLQRGLILPFRDDDGALEYKFSYNGGCGVEGVMLRYLADAAGQSPLVTVFDQTMATDLFINDGRCLGAVAMHIPTGGVRVFRANATINCTGPTSWIYGWKTVSAYSIQSPDNTGDIDMAAFRHGAAIGESEAMGFDFSTTYPEGFSFGWGTCLVPDAMEYPAFTDRNGKQIFSDEVIERYGFTPETFIASRAVFNRFLAQLSADGEFEAMDDGSIACDLSNYEPRTCMQENLKFFDKVGVDMKSSPVSVHEESYERGGTPVVDMDLMSEDIQGLYLLRGAGAGDGISGGSYTTLLFRNGYVAAQRAIEYADSAPAPDQVDWTPAIEEFERLQEIRTRSVENAIRPHAVRHEIQRACGSCMGIVRTVEALDAAIAEIERVRREDIPRMAVTSSSRTWNREWKEAIENYNLLDAAELAVKAARMREETRGEYYYVDFPEPDPSWEAKMLLARRSADGEIEWERRDVPQHAPFDEQAAQAAAGASE